MYQSFSISNFKCFEELKLDNLKRVNLIAGLNNVGKTSLLEAFFIHCGSHNPSLVLNINAFRGIDLLKVHFGKWIEAPWISLFNNFDSQKKIILHGKGDTLYSGCLEFKIRQDLIRSKSIESELERKLEIDKVRSNIFSPSDEGHELEFIFSRGQEKENFSLILDAKGLHKEPATSINFYPAFFHGSRSIMQLGETAEGYSNLIKKGKVNSLIKVLKIIEPRLKKLELLIEYGTPMIYGYLGLNRPFPLPLMGEGMVKLANTVLSIVNAQSGVVLIDEIENGFHHSNMEKIWSGLNKVSKEFDTQIFATTHSFECIRAAHEAFSEGANYDFRLIRLERVDNEIKPVYYDKDTLSSAIEFGFEVR